VVSCGISREKGEGEQHLFTDASEKAIKEERKEGRKEENECVS